MKERPIIFSVESVRAIMAGTKTQTRRIVKPQPHFLGDDGCPWIYERPYEHMDGVRVECRFSPGMRLWVREKFCQMRPEHRIGGKYIYAADWTAQSDDSKRCQRELGYKWQSPLFMPRAASRLTLEVVGVRVERVQDITEADVVAEGVDSISMSGVPRQATPNRRSDFAQIWDCINGNGSWASNPFVWVIEFKTVTTGNTTEGGAK